MKSKYEIIDFVLSNESVLNSFSFFRNTVEQKDIIQNSIYGSQDFITANYNMGDKNLKLLILMTDFMAQTFWYAKPVSITKDNIECVYSKFKKMNWSLDLVVEIIDGFINDSPIKGFDNGFLNECYYDEKMLKFIDDLKKVPYIE